MPPCAICVTLHENVVIGKYYRDFWPLMRAVILLLQYIAHPGSHCTGSKLQEINSRWRSWPKPLDQIKPHCMPVKCTEWVRLDNLRHLITLIHDWVAVVLICNRKQILKPISFVGDCQVTACVRSTIPSLFYSILEGNALVLYYILHCNVQWSLFGVRPLNDT